jgi:hypothetical protein
MSEFRNELRFKTQQAYGHYCSFAHSQKKEPVPYHIFADYYSKGLTVKEIFKQLNK